MLCGVLKSICVLRKAPTHCGVCLRLLSRSGWGAVCISNSLPPPACARPQYTGEKQPKMKNLKLHSIYEVPRGRLLTPSEQRAAAFSVKDDCNIYNTFLVEAGTGWGCVVVVWGFFLFVLVFNCPTAELISIGLKVFFTPSFSMSFVFPWYHNQTLILKRT